MNKMYLVKITEGRYSDETFTYPKFVTEDKEKAEAWIKKFNKIISNNRDRIDAWYDNILEYEDDTEPLWAMFIREFPVASLEEVEVR